MTRPRPRTPGRSCRRAPLRLAAVALLFLSSAAAARDLQELPVVYVQFSIETPKLLPYKRAPTLDAVSAALTELLGHKLPYWRFRRAPGDGRTRDGSPAGDAHPKRRDQDPDARAPRGADRSHREAGRRSSATAERGRLAGRVSQQLVFPVRKCLVVDLPNNTSTYWLAGYYLSGRCWRGKRVVLPESER